MDEIEQLRRHVAEAIDQREPDLGNTESEIEELTQALKLALSRWPEVDADEL